MEAAQEPDVNDPATREKLIRQWAKKYKWTTTDIEEQIKNFIDIKKDKQFDDKKDLYNSLNWWIGPGDEDEDDDIDVNYPTVFDTLEETINVMGHLFGRDAALDILKNKKNMWWMSLGITWDDKQSLSRILRKGD